MSKTIASGRSARLLALMLACCTAITGMAGPGERPADTAWRDTDGKPVNAHGGGVLFCEGKYYWYGESKSGPTSLPECNKSWGGTRVDVRGVSCYSSANLCDWKNEGLALGATPEDAAGDLHPSKVLERPKVIYNRATKQFVMWMHIDSEDYSAARCGVAVSGRPSGPFKYLGSFRPDAGYWPENASADDKKPDVSNLLARDFKGGQMARDLTLFVDDDGKAYLFYSSEENEAVHASVLTGDFLHTSGKYARIFVGRKMEAPVVFKRLGRYYFVASGCTAWQPNAARSAVADHPLGPWKELGNPCVGEGSETTFHSQGASVVPVQGRKDAYIFIADRWDQRDLAASSYLWLPLEFSAEGKPILRTGEWSSLSAFWRTNLTPRAE